MSRKDNVHGEGNYEASRKYDDATKKFVESGRVEQAARDAAPKTPREAADMKKAEEAALLRSKDKKAPVREPGAPPPAVDEPEGNPQEPSQKDASASKPRRPDRR